MNKLKNMRLGDIKVTTAIFVMVVGLVLYKLGFLMASGIALGLVAAVGSVYALIYIVKTLIEYVKENGGPAIGLLTMAVTVWGIVGFHYATK
jgi:hypothetical protein